MDAQSGHRIKDIGVEGGANRDAFLMQFQADILQSPLNVSAIEELSGLGPALLCAHACAIIDPSTYRSLEPKAVYLSEMSAQERDRRYDGWKQAVRRTLVD